MATPQTDRPDAGYDRDAVARGALYAVLARAFDNPDGKFHGAATDGSLAVEVETYLDRTALEIDAPDLTTARSHEDLSAVYNGLFALGHTEYTDRTDGSMAGEGPPVPLYECRYREASWGDVNQDLARAYEHFGVGISGTERDHHDNVRLELEFAAYLARREAIGEDDAGHARRDFLDRHLEPFASGVRQRLDEIDGEGFYAAVGRLFERVVTADLEALRETYGGRDDGRQ